MDSLHLEQAKIHLIARKASFLKFDFAEKEHIDEGRIDLESTIPRLHLKFWITRMRKLDREVIRRCRHCKLKFNTLHPRKCNHSHKTAKVESAIQNVRPDYFGPFEVKGEVQKRIHGKGYGILLVCDSSRAVHAEIAQDF